MTLRFFFIATYELSDISNADWGRIVTVFLKKYLTPMLSNYAISRKTEPYDNELEFVSYAILWNLDASAAVQKKKLPL